MKVVPTESISGQETGGTQERLLTVAVSRPWRGSQSPAAPGLPGQGVRIPDVRWGVNGQGALIPPFQLLNDSDAVAWNVSGGSV